MIDAPRIELTAIRGVQAGAAYYVVTCPSSTCPGSFPPVQRTLPIDPNNRR